LHQPPWSSWVRFPNERNQGKQAHPVLKYRVPHGSQDQIVPLWRGAGGGSVLAGTRRPLAAGDGVPPSLHTASHTQTDGKQKCAWGPPEQRRSAGERGGGWRLRLFAVADSGAADRSVGSDSAHAAVPGSLAGLPRVFRSVAHGGRGCNPGPRAWGARRGRAVAYARGGVAWRAACGCAATTYLGLRPGGYCGEKP
jgi:hypothetical protein